jgi:hypothetical protein
MQKFNQSDEKVPTDFSDIFNQVQNDIPVTRAKVKLIKYEDAAK